MDRTSCNQPALPYTHTQQNEASSSQSHRLNRYFPNFHSQTSRTHFPKLSLGWLSMRSARSQDAPSTPPLNPKEAAQAHLQNWAKRAPTKQEKKVRRQLLSHFPINAVSIDENGAFIFHGDINFHETDKLTHFPDNVIISGNLDLSSCTDLTTLPKGLTVLGNLNLQHCKRLTALPKHITVEGNCDLSLCYELESLPEDLTVLGDLDCSFCMHLMVIPPTIQVSGNMNFMECWYLSELPKDLNVPHDLTLTSCSRLTSLTENFLVGGSLNLSNCFNLITLPDNLTVMGNLDLSHCEHLAQLPQALYVSGDIDLSGCMDLADLPDSFSTLGSKNNGQVRQINLTNTDIPTSVINRLRASNIEGVQFIFGHPVIKPNRTYKTLTDAINSWSDNIGSDNIGPNNSVPNNSDSTGLEPQRWNLNAQCYNGEETLRKFLSALHNTPEASNSRTLPSLQRRVHSFLKQMQLNQNDFQAQALQRIRDVMEGCEDRAIWMMNQLELLTQVHEATQKTNTEAALRTLGKSYLALEVLHRHAAQKCLRSHFVDPIEVYLALEVRLSQPLQLPVSTQNLTYERAAQWTGKEIEHIKKEALKAINNQDQVNEFLNRWEPWQHFKRQEHANQLSWDSLQRSKHTFPDNAHCAITMTPLTEIHDPVIVNQTLYSFSAFTRWWVDHGTDPILRAPKPDLSDVFALSPQTEQTMTKGNG